MISRLSRFLAIGLIIFSFSSMLIPTAYAADIDVKKNVCNGAEISLDDKGCTDPKAAGGANQRVNALIANVTNILSLIVGIVAVIMIIVSGFKYVTSGGDSARVSSAKTTIIYAIIGLIIVVLAQIIVRFVIGKATGSTTGAPAPTP